MTTVDGRRIDRMDAKFLNRFNRVSFDFCQPRDAKRSETIAKRSKTPLRKSNSMMVLRSTDTIAFSAAPSSVDVDDVTSSSCSIDCSPVPTDSSSSTGKDRRRRLPSLPTQESRQRSVVVSAGGATVTGLQRKHSCVWPSRSGANHHYLIDGVDHRGNRVLNGFSSNYVSLLPSESIKLSGSSVDLYRNDLVNHRPHDHKGDPINRHPSQSDAVNQIPTVSGNRNVNGSVGHCSQIGDMVRHQGRNVTQSPGDSHHLHNNVNPPWNDNIGRHKSELTIHLQGQNDIQHKETDMNHLQERKDAEVKDASRASLHGQRNIQINHADVNRCTREIKPCNTSPSIPQHQSDVDIDHCEGSTVNQKNFTDETLQRELANECQKEEVGMTRCTSHGFSDIPSAGNGNSDHIATFKTGGDTLRDNSSHGTVFDNYRIEMPSLSERNNLYPRDTVINGNEIGEINDLCDKLNHRRQNARNAEKESVPSTKFNVDSVEYGQRHRKKKLQASTSLEENYSLSEPAFQVSGRGLQRKASMDLAYGVQSKALKSNDIAPIEVMAIRLSAKPKRSPALFHKQTSFLDSKFESSSSFKDHRDDFKESHEIVGGITRKQKNSFQRQGGELRERDQTVSDRRGSSNYLISPSQKTPNNSWAFSETSAQSLKHNSSTLSSSGDIMNTGSIRTVLKHHGMGSPKHNRTKTSIAVESTSGKHYPLSRTKKVSEGNINRSPEINRTAPRETDLHVSPSPERSTTPIGDPPPSALSLHSLLQTHRIVGVSLVRSIRADDCGVKLLTVPFMAGTAPSGRPASLAPKGKRATKLGSPDGAFRAVAAVETVSGRDVHPQVVMVAGVEDESVAAAGGSIEEGDVVIEVNGKYVLGSTIDVIERLLAIHQQHLYLVLAKPIPTTDPKPMNASLVKTNRVSGIPPTPVKQRTSPTTLDEEHSIPEHVHTNCRSFPDKTIAVRPRTLSWSSEWSPESAHTLRPIQVDSKRKMSVTAGYSEPDEAYYPSSDSCDDGIPDSDYRWQKISAV